MVTSMFYTSITITSIKESATLHTYLPDCRAKPLRTAHPHRPRWHAGQALKHLPKGIILANNLASSHHKGIQTPPLDAAAPPVLPPGFVFPVTVIRLRV